MTTQLLTLSTYKTYINGEWKESRSGHTIDIRSPYLHEVIGKVQAITQEEIDEAIYFAHEAQKNEQQEEIDGAIYFAHEAQKEWAEASLGQRASYLYKWADELVNMQDEIAEMIMKEVGKSYKDAKNASLTHSGFHPLHD